MEFFRIHRTIPFMRYRHILNGISLVSFLVAVYWLFAHGLAFSIEFTGGTQLEVNYPEAANTEQIRTDLAQVSNEVLVQTFGTARDVVIRVPTKEGQTSGQVAAEVMKVLSAKTPGVQLKRRSSSALRWAMSSPATAARRLRSWSSASWSIWPSDSNGSSRWPPSSPTSTTW